MKETIFKILKILGITLGILACIFIVLAVVSLIFPSVSYFGYRFIAKNYNSSEVVISSPVPFSSYNINISTTKYGIEIMGSDEVAGVMSYSYTGFHLGVSDAENVKVMRTINGNSLNITVLEPLGLVTSINCKILIKVSSAYSYNISVSTDSAKTTISNVQINHLNGVSKSGDFSVTHETRQLTMQSLNIITTSGDIDFSALDDLTIQSKSYISALDSKFTFNNLNASLFIRGSKIFFSAKQIDASINGFEVVCSSGSFVVLAVISGEKDFTIVSDACNIQISNVTGRSSMTTTSGSVNIKDLNSRDCIIRTTSGNVTVKNAADNIFVITNSGNINVEEFYKTGQFATYSGNINVISLSPYDINYHTSISTNSGNVIFENNVNKSMISMAGGQANVKFWRVAQTGDLEHRINNVNGKTSIGIMAELTDIIRFKLVGTVSGSIRELELYADDSFIIRPTGSTYTAEATFYCTGGQLVFQQLDPR